MEKPQRQRHRRGERHNSFIQSSASSGVSANPLSSVYSEENTPPPASVERPALQKRNMQKIQKKKYLGAAGQKKIDDASFETFVSLKLQKLNGRASLARFKKFSSQLFLGEGKILLKIHKAGISPQKASHVSPLETFAFEVGSLQNINYRSIGAKSVQVTFFDDPHVFVLATPTEEQTRILIRMLLNEIKTQAMAFDKAVSHLVAPDSFSDLLGKADDGASAELPERIRNKSGQITELLQECLYCWTLARGRFHDDVFEAQENLAKWFKLIGEPKEAKHHLDILMSRRQEYSNRLRFEMDHSEERIPTTPLEQLQNASDMVGANHVRIQAKRVDLDARADILIKSLNSKENVNAMELAL